MHILFSRLWSGTFLTKFPRNVDDAGTCSILPLSSKVLTGYKNLEATVSYLRIDSIKIAKNEG